MHVCMYACVFHDAGLVDSSSNDTHTSAAPFDVCVRVERIDRIEAERRIERPKNAITNSARKKSKHIFIFDRMRFRHH